MKKERDLGNIPDEFWWNVGEKIGENGVDDMQTTKSAYYNK